MKRKIIMLIEDNEGDVLLLREAFQELKEDIELVAFSSMDQLVESREAIQNLFVNSTGITLLDLNIPSSSGWEILSWLKGDDFFRIQPVIVLTSSRSSNDVEKAFRYGASAYIPKPDDFQGYRRMTQSLVEFWFHVSVLTEQPRY